MIVFWHYQQFVVNFNLKEHEIFMKLKDSVYFKNFDFLINFILLSKFQFFL
jgi:hypothetical protein